MPVMEMRVRLEYSRKNVGGLSFQACVEMRLKTLYVGCVCLGVGPCIACVPLRERVGQD